MPEFQFTAYNQNGASQRGAIVADSLEAAGEALDRKGLIPIRIQPRHSLGDSLRKPRGSVHWKIEEKILFTRKLASLLKAGLPLVRVFGLVAEQMRDERVSAALRDIADKVSSGSTLTDALAKYPRLFDQVYLGALRTGEATGQLDMVLDHLADFLEKEMNTLRMVKATVRYPILVVLALIVAGGVVMGFVVPKFMSFYTHYGGQLPLPTRILIAASNLTRAYWWVLPVVGTGLWFARREWVKTPKGRQTWDSWMLRVPIFGPLFLKVAVSRFARLFGIMFAAGIPAASALQIVAEGVGNTVIGGEITAMRDRLTVGESVALKPSGTMMPDLVYQMLGIGFESGEVDRMLGEVSRHFDQEVEYDVRRLRDNLEPVILAVLATGVLIFALAVLMPMWNLLTLFKN
ncbi:MAG: type II secretion system F family protein [Candidatus Zixiibacteriota bacterium]